VSIQPLVPTRHLRSFVALTLVATFAVVAGCAPPPTTTCVDGTVDSAQDYSNVFRSYETEWITGDGAFPIALGSGELLWIFGDTFTGEVVPHWDLDEHRLVHNTFVLQHDSCFSPKYRGGVGRRRAVLPTNAPGRWYWPLSGIVAGNELQLLALDVAYVDHGTPGFDWEIAGADLITISLDTYRVLSIVDSPGGGRAPDPAYGTAVVQDGSTVYSYGHTNQGQFVARSTTATFATGPWEFWDGSGWSSDPSAAAPMTVAQNSLSPFHVIKWGNGWLAAAKMFDVLSSDVSAWTAPAPQGPWTRFGEIAQTPTRAGQFSYGGLLADLPGAGPTVIYSVNSTLEAIAEDVRVYGPKFRVPTALPLPTP
jgi:hypothetical protein